MDLNIRKMTNHPPSPEHMPEHLDAITIVVVTIVLVAAVLCLVHLHTGTIGAVAIIIVVAILHLKHLHTSAIRAVILNSSMIT